MRSKKYQAIETKVHWITWTVIAAVFTLLVTLTIAIQPSAKETFYNSYYSVSTEAQFPNKLPEKNKYNLVNTLEDKWFGLEKGLYSLGERNDHLTIVYFGHPSNEAPKQVANVYARLYGSSETEPAIEASALYNSLGDNKLSLYYFGVKQNDFEAISKSLNEHYPDTELTEGLPLLLVLLDGKVVDFKVLDGETVPLMLLNFYNDVLENSDVANLIQ